MDDDVIIKCKDIIISFNDQEIKILVKYLIQDAIDFHATMLNDMNELGIDLPEDLESESAKKDFLSCPSLFSKLKELGIDTKNLEKLK